ncbi:hypothetical protein [Actinosynnema sp. NPDC023587]|uniref:hypothetical protein n=1 Tax=Actinosynnema sp. NPDC023587 TaxID=3154695 RepID=UPI0033D2C115
MAAQLDGFRQWPGGWADGIRVRHAGEALGIRTDPDQRIVWEETGPFGEIAGGLLLLPAPGHRLAPAWRAVTGRTSAGGDTAVGAAPVRRHLAAANRMRPARLIVTGIFIPGSKE